MNKAYFNKVIMLGITTALCVISLSGCSVKKGEDVKTDVTVIENNALEQPLQITSVKGDGTDYQAYWGTKVQCVTKGEHGYYYLTLENPLYLMYFDDETQESIKVCGKAECNHDNAQCNAYFGDIRWYDKKAEEQEYSSGQQLYYYNGLLYLLGTEGNLISVTPDGSERKKIANVYTYDGSSNTKLAFYDNYVYVYNSAGNQGSSETHTETIKRYSLDGKTQENIVEWNAVSGAIHSVKNYGDKMFFLTSSLKVKKEDSVQEWNYEYNGLYAYDHKTAQAGKVIDAAITGYAVDEEREKIYYFVYGDGLYAYDVKTGQADKLFESPEEIGIADMSYDGQYLYLYNGEWASYAKQTNGTSLQRQCWVLEPDGTIVQQLEIYRYGFCFFGDRDYIFAEQMVPNAQTGEPEMKLTYMEKAELLSGQWKVLE